MQTAAAAAHETETARGAETLVMEVAVVNLCVSLFVTPWGALWGSRVVAPEECMCGMRCSVS